MTFEKINDAGASYCLLETPHQASQRVEQKNSWAAPAPILKHCDIVAPRH
jgi:hypothetical protein